MNTEIIVAILALIGTWGGSWLGVRQSNKLVNYRIDRLEKKVDKHNHVVERVTKLEESVKLTNYKISEIKGEHCNGTE